MPLFSLELYVRYECVDNYITIQHDKNDIFQKLIRNILLKIAFIFSSDSYKK